MAKKPKINIDRFRMSSEDINKMKNFKDVLQAYTTNNGIWNQIRHFKKILLVASALLVVALSIVAYNNTTVRHHFNMASSEDTLYRSRPEKMIFTPDELPEQKFKINILKDTLLTTLNGAKITIKAGTLKNEECNEVTLLLKEAYTPEQILKSGLTTMSDGQLLSSGGMFNLVPESDKTLIASAIQIEVPTASVNPNMQLFKGQLSSSGEMNWTNPELIKGNEEKLQIVSEGERLFKENCKSCHVMGRESVGPDLSSISQFRDKKWLAEYIRNSSKLIASADPLAVCLFNKYNKTQMTSFPTFSDKQIQSLLTYFEKFPITTEKNADLQKQNSCIKRCKEYDELYNKTMIKKYSLMNQRSKKVNDNSEFVQQINSLSANLGSNDILPNNNFNVNNSSLVNPVTKQSEYYKIEIKTFGWYNIDMFLKLSMKVKKVKLTAKIENTNNPYSQVFLLIPKLRLHTQGGFLQESAEKYSFAYKDGTIDLPENSEVIIYAINESSKGIEFAYSCLSIDGDKDVTLKLTTYSKEDFTKEINTLLGNNKVIVEDSKNSKEIRKIDEKLTDIDKVIEEVTKLKPTDCDCDCYRTFRGRDSIYVEYVDPIFDFN
jgi:mono/diheme cytochrome c family protein